MDGRGRVSGSGLGFFSYFIVNILPTLNFNIIHGIVKAHSLIAFVSLFIRYYSFALITLKKPNTVSQI